MGNKNKEAQLDRGANLSSILKKGIWLVIYSFISIFVVSNVISAINVPDIFFKLAKNDHMSLIQLLSHAGSLSYFYKIAPEVQNIMIQNSDEILKETRERNKQIKSLAALLQLNPESPQVHYALHLLYQAQKDHKNSNIYLQKARQIDPDIGIVK